MRKNTLYDICHYYFDFQISRYRDAKSGEHHGTEHTCVIFSRFCSCVWCGWVGLTRIWIRISSRTFLWVMLCTRMAPWCNIHGRNKHNSSTPVRLPGGHGTSWPGRCQETLTPSWCRRFLLHTFRLHTECEPAVEVCWLLQGT